MRKWIRISNFPTNMHRCCGVWCTELYLGMQTLAKNYLQLESKRSEWRLVFTFFVLNCNEDSESLCCNCLCGFECFFCEFLKFISEEDIYVNNSFVRSMSLKVTRVLKSEKDFNRIIFIFCFSSANFSFRETCSEP